jgi:hypothetical protein
MSKKGTYNSNFFNKFAARHQGTSVTFGFLVGTRLRDGQRDVVFAAPTPPEPGEEGATAEAPKIAEILKGKGRAQFSTWALQHREALQKLLPGNLEPCGCFLVTSETVAKDLAPNLASILKGVADPLVFSLGEKISHWTHSSEGGKVVLRPANLKPETHKDSLLLWSATLIDFVAPQSQSPAEAGTPQALTDEAKASLGASLQNCTVGVAAKESAPLQIVSSAGEALISDVASKDCTDLRASFLQSGSVLFWLPNPDGSPCSRQRCLVVAVVLLLRRDREFREALDDLRQATVASAAARLQLALEEADGASGRIDVPWRALCRPQDVELPLWCGDFCMPDESKDDAQERLGQLLDVQDFETAPAHLDEYLLLQQRFPNSYKPESASSTTGTGGRSTSKSSSSNSMLACAAAVGALLVAVTIPLVLRM